MEEINKERKKESSKRMSNTESKEIAVEEGTDE